MTHITLLFQLIFAMLFKGCIAPIFIHQFASRHVKISKWNITGAIIDFPRESVLHAVRGHYGIPFASSSFRFMPPSEVEMIQMFNQNRNESLSCPQMKWKDNIFVNNEFSKGTQTHLWRIMQSTLTQQESCLFLNVFVPLVGEYDKCLGFHGVFNIWYH